MGVGCWCGSLQLAFIYGLSFLWSATPATVLYVLLAWVLGGLLGLHQVRVAPAWIWMVPLVPFWLTVASMNIPPQFMLISSFLAGGVAGHWVSCREPNFLQALRWESLGMGVGYLVTGMTAYRGLEALVIWCSLITLVLVWREKRWGRAGSPFR